MEHKIILGGEQYLPFARSRIKALRAAGMRYATQRFILSDAEVAVRLEGDLDYIYLSGGMPHGFVAVTNWKRPTFIKYAPETGWSIDSRAVPQARADITATNQVLRADTKVLPLVFSTEHDKLFDQVPRGGFTGDSDPVPVVLQYPDDEGVTQFLPKPAHYMVGLTIQGKDEAVLYTMEAADQIGDDDTVSDLAGSSDSSGVNAVLQTYRTALLSEITDQWAHRFCNEVLTRSGEAVYTLSSRNTIAFNTPIGSAQAVDADTFFTLDADEGHELFAVFFDYGNTGTTKAPPFTGPNLFCAFGPGTERTDTDWTSSAITTESAERYEYASTASASAIVGVVALPEVDSVRQVALNVAMSWPRTMYFRGGTKNWAFNVAANYPSGADVYGLNSLTKERRDAILSQNATPMAALDLGWLSFKVFEGTAAAAMSGKYYKDTEIGFRNSGSFPTFAFIIEGAAPSVIGATEQENWDYINSFTNHADEWQGEWGAAPSGTVETVFNDEQLTLSGSYSYTSRHIIDYDHRAQFVAAIRVEVICTGAGWVQSTEEFAHRGALMVQTDPSYTVNIWFESNWKGTTAQQLLASGTATRPAYEFTEIFAPFNPFRYPDSDIGFEMRYFLPPEVALPKDIVAGIVRTTDHQGVNPNLAAEDCRPELAATMASSKGVELSPMPKYVQGQLYARSFKLSELTGALWLLDALSIDMTEGDSPTGTPWFYFLALKNTIDTQDFHIEVRNGVIEDWSDSIEVTDDPDTEEVEVIPAATARDIKLYRV